jgi:hypothetical protein
MSRSGTVYTTIYLPPVTEYVPSTVYTTVYVPSYVTLPYYVPTAVATTPARVTTVGTVYREVSYPMPIPVPVEVYHPVVVLCSEDAGTEVGDAVTLRPVYVEVPYLIPIVIPVEVGGAGTAAPVSETTEVLVESSEATTLRPHYVEATHPLGLVHEEVVPVVVARESSEVLVEHSEALPAQPHPLDRLTSRDREVLDFLASRLARLYTIAEFVSRSTWDLLRSYMGLTDDNIKLIMRYIRGERLSEDELRRLAELYAALQYAGSILDHEAILRELEKLVPTAGATGAVERRWTLADYERMLKERVLRGEEPQVSPGRQLAWNIENLVRFTDVLGRGLEATYSFLRGLGVPDHIARGLASFLTSFGRRTATAVPVVGPPVVLALVGLSLVDFMTQLFELTDDEFERSVLTEELLRILDPSRAPPELRPHYEAARQQLIASIAGAVAGELAGLAVQPIIAERLAQLLSSRFPKLAQKLSQYRLGELVPKEQEWDVRVDTKTGEVLVVRYERGTVKTVGRFTADPRVVAALGRGSQRELAAFAERLMRVTGKSDVSEELSTLVQRLLESLRAAGVEPTDDAIREALRGYSSFLENLIKSLPEELRGRSLLEITRQVTYVNAGGRLVPALDLGERLVLSVGDKTITVTKGVLAAVGTVERLRSLGVFEDVVNLLRQGLGGRGLVYRPDLGVVVELTQDGKLIVRVGARVEVLTALDPRYLLEARQLLETLDPSVVRALSTVITAPYTAVTPPTTAVASPADVVASSITKTLASAGKLASAYETVTLASGGRVASVSVLRDIYDRARDVLVDVVLGKNLSGLRSLLGPQYERYTLFTLKLDAGLASRLAEHIERAGGDVLRAVSEAMRTASGTELAQLRLLQLMLQSNPGVVVPVATTSTSEGVLMVLATAVPALAQLTLTAEDLRRLGIEERAVTQGLRAVYVETTYPIVVPRVVEVSRPAYAYDRSEVALDRSEELALRPVYLELPYPIAVPVPVEVSRVVYRPESVELAHAAEEVLGLRPAYLEIYYPVPRVLPQELTRVIHLPDARELPYEVEGSIELVPAYLEVYYPALVATRTYGVGGVVHAVEAVEVPQTTVEVVELAPTYAEELYPVPATLPLELLGRVYATLEEELPLEASQPADVYVYPVELEVFETYYYPYAELQVPEAGVAPPAVAGGVAVAGVPPPPWAAPTAREEAVARLRKPKELEKVVL